MRKAVLVPVEHTYCDAHLARHQSDVEATAALTLGHRAWDLCVDHRAAFARYLVDALGTGVPDAVESDAEAKPESVVVAEPAPFAAEPEPMRSVMLAGEVPGYDWQAARDALRNAGFEVVGRADGSTVLLILGGGGERKGHKVRDAAERAIPCMDVREPGRFKSAVLSGEFTGGAPFPSLPRSTARA
uniref:BRCT domain-containing protein n=1 Tax=Streptomyces sp. NBC_00003 TaxID=2903608 RepID=A0AAU2UZ03_9ACTN